MCFRARIVTFSLLAVRVCSLFARDVVLHQPWYFGHVPFACGSHHGSAESRTEALQKCSNGCRAEELRSIRMSDGGILDRIAVLQASAIMIAFGKAVVLQPLDTPKEVRDWQFVHDVVDGFKRRAKNKKESFKEELQEKGNRPSKRFAYQEKART